MKNQEDTLAIENASLKNVSQCCTFALIEFLI